MSGHESFGESDWIEPASTPETLPLSDSPEILPEPRSNSEILQAVYRHAKAAKSRLNKQPVDDFQLSFLSGQTPLPEQFDAAIQAANDNGAYEALRDLYLEINP